MDPVQFFYSIGRIYCLFLLASGLLAGQNQTVADSVKHILEREHAGDSLHRARLRLVAFNETDPAVAVQFADRLIKLAAKDSIFADMKSGYLQKGNKKRLQGNLNEALDAYFKSLKYAKKIVDPASIGAIFSCIADIYSINNNAENALLYYEKAISTLRQTTDSLSLAKALLNLGDQYYNEKKYQKALKCFDEAGKIFQLVDYPLGIGYNLGNTGMVYASLGKPGLAEKNINQAVQILEAFKDYYPISVYLNYTSDIYLERGDLPLATKYASRSLELAQRYGLKDQISEANFQLSKLYEQAGDHKTSLAYYKGHVLYRDSVNNLETVQKLANLRTDYEISQKQVEVNLLQEQKRNQQIIVIGTIIALFLIALLALGLYRRNRYIQETSRIIEQEKNRSERLLLNILPEETAQELMVNGKVKAQRLESVSVLFADFKGFTSYAEKVSPEELVKNLDYYFSKFDQIMEKYDLEKIKTIGDAYMCAGGLPHPSGGHAEKVVKAAFDMIEIVNSAQVGLEIRIGINTGPIVAGVVGTKKFAYDIWGDAVNVASRMESNSESGKINISENTFELIKDQFDCVLRGEMEIKNRGRMKMYFVEGEKEFQAEIG